LELSSIDEEVASEVSPVDEEVDEEDTLTIKENEQSEAEEIEDTDSYQYNMKEEAVAKLLPQVARQEEGDE
jgi:hypothetical protein